MAEIIRYDFEFALTEAAVEYVRALLPDEIQANRPVIGWVDSMSWLAEDRITILSTEANGSAETIAEADCQLEIGVKTKLAQATLQSDMERHRLAVDEVRGALAIPADDILDGLNEHRPRGIRFSFVGNAREYSSDINDIVIYSSVRLSVKCFPFREESFE